MAENYHLLEVEREARAAGCAAQRASARDSKLKWLVAKSAPASHSLTRSLAPRSNAAACWWILNTYRWGINVVLFAPHHHATDSHSPFEATLHKMFPNQPLLRRRRHRCLNKFIAERTHSRALCFRRRVQFAGIRSVPIRCWAGTCWDGGWAGG